MAEPIELTVNGQHRSLQVAAERSLLDVLRHELGLTATRLGCGLGQCGACTVLLDGRAVNACDTPLWSAAGKEVTTLEGLGTREAPHPLQAAFIKEQALQCGWCTSGLIMRAAELLQQQPQADEAAIRQALDRNLCRCGVHNRVVRAVQNAAAAMHPPEPR